MAGIEDECDGVGPLGRDLAGEVAHRRAHLVLRQVGCRRHFKTGIGKELRHRFGVIAGIGQRRNRFVGGLTDHQREAALGE